MPTIMESLLAEHAILLQKIIDQAKKDALSSQASSSGITGTTNVVKLDLLSQINSNFDNLIKEKKERNIISGYVDPLKWTRNINCWAKSLDLTGTSVGIWGLGGVGGGTLVTKKHILLANHVPYPALPFTLYFVDNNNKSYEYKVIKTKRVGITDILIGELDKEADAALKVYNVLPANYLKYFDKTNNFPVLYSDQEKKALISEFGSPIDIDNSVCIQLNPPNNSNRSQYFEPLAVGDSGNIVGTIINNEVVLIGAWYRTWYNNSGISTNIPHYIADINNTILSLSSGYKLKEADLSAFKTF